MNENAGSDRESETSYLVIELEAEDGALTEFVLVDTLKIEQREYALLIPLARVPDLDELPFEDWSPEAQDEFISILRVEGDKYFELTADELKELNAMLDALVTEDKDGD